MGRQLPIEIVISAINLINEISFCLIDVGNRASNALFIFTAKLSFRNFPVGIFNRFTQLTFHWGTSNDYIYTSVCMCILLLHLPKHNEYYIKYFAVLVRKNTYQRVWVSYWDTTNKNRKNRTQAAWNFSSRSTCNEGVTLCQRWFYFQIKNILKVWAPL